MRVLVACEESQAVTIELRKLGHEAYSCDVIECSGGHPEWHIMQDVLPLINGCCEFDTMDDQHHIINTKWDFIRWSIAPPLLSPHLEMSSPESADLALFCLGSDDSCRARLYIHHRRMVRDDRVRRLERVMAGSLATGMSALNTDDHAHRAELPVNMAVTRRFLRA